MKSAVDMLVDYLDDPDDERVLRLNVNEFQLVTVTRNELEHIAQRAREEMKQACLRAFSEQCRDFDNGSDSVPSLTEECIEGALNNLPVK